MRGGEKSGAGRRPNAEYKLSDHPRRDEEKLVFRYSREERLAKAPRAVQDLYKEEARPKFSLLRPLVGSRPRAAMFASIMILCVAILGMSVFGFLEGGYVFGANRLRPEALRFEGTTIISLKKSRSKNREAYTGAVDIGVSPVFKGETEPAEGDYPVFIQRVFFTMNDEEEYRFTAPFDSEELILVFQGEKDTLSVKIKCE
jgi:hypothetical protein